MEPRESSWTPVGVTKARGSFHGSSNEASSGKLWKFLRKIPLPRKLEASATSVEAFLNPWKLPLLPLKLPLIRGSFHLHPREK